MDLMWWVNVIYMLIMISVLMMMLFTSPFIIASGHLRAFYMMFIDTIVIAYISFTYIKDSTDMVKLNIPFIIMTIALIQIAIIEMMHADKFPVQFMECCK